MINVILYHVITEKSHPLFIFRAVHVTAPFADKFWSDILCIYICPCIVPIIIKKSLFSKIFVKPCLRINRRTIVVRRINYLTCSVFGIYGIFSCAAEVSSPPCADIWRINFSVADSPIISGHCAAERLLNALDHNERIRIHLKDSVGAYGSRISPVILICRTVPLGSVSPLLTLAVGLVFQIVADKSIVVFIFIGKPYKRFSP